MVTKQLIWKTGFFIMLGLTIWMMIIIVRPNNEKFYESRIYYIMNELKQLSALQNQVKYKKIIDKNGNNIGEYANELNTLTMLTRKNDILEKLLYDSHYAHYEYTIRTGETVKNQEEGFEIFAIPKFYYQCDKWLDGIIWLTVDEEGIVRYAFFSNHPERSWRPNYGKIKEWTAISECAITFSD